jgi:hypothetical protein
MAGHFASLEQEAKADRNPDARFPGGYSKLRYFYRTLGSFGKDHACGCIDRVYDTSITFGEKLAALNQWTQANPASIAAALAKAELWKNLAWVARGNDYIANVPDQSVELFTARAEKSASYLAPLNPASDPDIYEAKLGLLRVIGNGRNDMATLYPAAINTFPTYFFYHRAMAGLLLPRWFGAPGELQQYLHLLASPESGDTGLIAYSFVAEQLSTLFTRQDLFHETGLDWPTLQRSYVLRSQRYGSSLKLLNHELWLAVAAANCPAASHLLQQIGTKWDPYIWDNWTDFAQVADWAGLPPNNKM